MGGQRTQASKKGGRNMSSMRVALASMTILAMVIAVPLHIDADTELGHIDADKELGHVDADLGESVKWAGEGSHDADMMAGTFPGTAAFDGTGRHDRGPDSGIHNMAGAPYGLPGYKESHDWVGEIDVFMPAVFNWRFYAASEGLTDQSEIEVKTHWRDTGLARSYPNCPKGIAMFNLNRYSELNSVVATDANINGNCMKLLNNYLTTGIYEGLSGAAGFTVTAEGQTTFGVSSESRLLAPDKMAPATNQYTMTFWVQLNGRPSQDATLIQLTETQHPIPFAMYVAAGTEHLKLQVATGETGTSSTSLKCETDTDLVWETWYHIAVVQTELRVDMYVDGVLNSCAGGATADTNVQEMPLAEANAGYRTTIAGPEAKIYVGTPGTEVASGNVRLLRFYPNTALTTTEMEVQMELERAEA